MNIWRKAVRLNADNSSRRQLLEEMRSGLSGKLRREIFVKQAWEELVRCRGTYLREEDFEGVQRVLGQMVVCPIDKHAVEGYVL